MKICRSVVARLLSRGGVCQWQQIRALTVLPEGNKKQKYEGNLPQPSHHFSFENKYSFHHLTSSLWAAVLAFFLVNCEDTDDSEPSPPPEQLSLEEEYMVRIGSQKGNSRGRDSDEGWGRERSSSSQSYESELRRANASQSRDEQSNEKKADNVDIQWKNLQPPPAAPIFRPGITPDALVIEKADRMYNNNDINGLYAFLIAYKETKNANILWRLARATCDYAKNTAVKEARKKCMYEAHGFAKEALELDKNISACHKWYGIMLDYVGEYEGTSKRISNAYEVKERFLDAIRLNPRDATSIHLLGYWCFVFADLSWVQKKLAAAIFAKPPESTFDEALHYFLEAEKIDPNFYLMNQMLIGKTYMRLKHFEEAKGYLTTVTKSTLKTPDDKKAFEEAQQLLKQIPKEKQN